MAELELKLHWIARRVAAWAFGSADGQVVGQAADVFRRGRLGAIDIKPVVISTTARSGHRDRPFVIYMRAPRLSEDAWRAIEAALAEDPFTVTELVAGRLSDVSEGVLGALVPSSWDSVTQQCTCDDWSTACRHAIALTMALAKLFAREPLKLVAWRGRPPERLIENVVRLRDALSGSEGSPLGDDLAGFFDSPSPLVIADEPVRRVEALLAPDGLRSDEDEAWLAETLGELSAFTRASAARGL